MIDFYLGQFHSKTTKEHSGWKRELTQFVYCIMQAARYRFKERLLKTGKITLVFWTSITIAKNKGREVWKG